jgi:hypothetical protein
MNEGPPMNQNDLGMAIVKGACNPEAKSLAVDLSEKALESLLEEVEIGT